MDLYTRAIKARAAANFNRGQHREEPRDDHSDDLPPRARIPADVDTPDKIVYGLTARQLAILAVAGVVGYGIVQDRRARCCRSRCSSPSSSRSPGPRSCWRWAAATACRWTPGCSSAIRHSPRSRNGSRPAAAGRAEPAPAWAPGTATPVRRCRCCGCPPRAIAESGVIDTGAARGRAGRLHHRQHRPAHRRRAGRADRRVRAVAQQPGRPGADRHLRPAGRPVQPRPTHRRRRRHASPTRPWPRRPATTRTSSTTSPPGGIRCGAPSPSRSPPPARRAATPKSCAAPSTPRPRCPRSGRRPPSWTAAGPPPC